MNLSQQAKIKLVIEERLPENLSREIAQIVSLGVIFGLNIVHDNLELLKRDRKNWNEIDLYLEQIGHVSKPTEAIDRLTPALYLETAVSSFNDGLKSTGKEIANIIQEIVVLQQNQIGTDDILAAKDSSSDIKDTETAESFLTGIIQDSLIELSEISGKIETLRELLIIMNVSENEIQGIITAIKTTSFIDGVGR